MNFIRTSNFTEGKESLADAIATPLHAGKKVLWLIPGGSNISVSVAAMKTLRQNLKTVELKNLAVTLTDERYGPIDHPDSNWRQLSESGLSFEGMNAIPVLSGLPLAETVAQYGKNVEAAFDAVDIVIGQFGIGPDGHIAGILPESPAVAHPRFACGYETPQFTRITLTPLALKKVDHAFAFASGASKKMALGQLKSEDLTLDEQPAQVLKQMKEAVLYSDQV